MAKRLTEKQKSEIAEYFKNGKTITYSHDKAFEIMKDGLEAMNCWSKYKSYTATNNIPKVLRDTDAVISSEDATVEVEEVETATPEVAF